MVSELNIAPPTKNRFAALAQPTKLPRHTPDDTGSSGPGSECSDDEIKPLPVPVSLLKSGETRTLSVENLALHEAEISRHDEEVAIGKLPMDDDEFHEIAGTDPIPRYGGGYVQAWGSRVSKSPRKHQSFECRSEAAFSLVEDLAWEDMASTPLTNEDMLIPALEPLDSDISTVCTCTSCNDNESVTLESFLETSTEVENTLGLKDWNATRKETMRQLLKKIEEEQGHRPRSARRRKRPSLGARRIGPSSYSNPTPGFAKASAERRERFQRNNRVLKHESNPIVRPIMTPSTPNAPPGFPSTPCRPIPETPVAPVCAPDCLHDEDDQEVVVECERITSNASLHFGSNSKARKSIANPESPVRPVELRWTTPRLENIQSCPTSAKSDGQVFFQSAGKPDKSLSLPAFLERCSAPAEQHRADCQAQQDWSEANGIFPENFRGVDYGPQTVTDNERNLLETLDKGQQPDGELLRRVAADCYLRRCSSKSRKFFESINGDLLELIWHAKNGKTPSAGLLQRVKRVLPYLNTEDLGADFEPMKRFMVEGDAKTPHPALVLSGVDTRAKMPHLKKDPATRDPAETEAVWAERDGWTYLNLGLYDKNVDANLPEDKSDPKWKEHHDQQKKKTKQLEERYMAKKRKARWKAIARKERQCGRGNFVIPPEPKLTKKEEKEIRSIVSQYGVHRFRNRGICRVMFQKKGGDGPSFKTSLAMLRAMKTLNRLRAIGVSSVRWMCDSDEAVFTK